MQDLETFLRACRGHAYRNYSLPDLVDVSHRVLEADFECGYSPESAIDAIAKDIGLVHRRDWTFAKASALIGRLARPVVTPLKRRSA